MTWTTIGGIVLLAWIAIATGILVVAFIRRLLRPKELPKPLLGYSWFGLDGPIPHVTRPEWVDWDEAKPSDDD